MFYPGEVEAAERAMEEKRRELIAQPLARIYRDLAMAGLEAAAHARREYLDAALTEMIGGVTPENRHPEI